MTKRFRVLCMVVFALIICTGTVSAYNGEKKNVTLIALDLDGVYKTSTETVGEFLKEIDINLKAEDYVSKGLDEVLLNNDVIEIRKAFPIILSIDGVPRMVYTSRSNVGDVVKDYKDDLSTNYRLVDITESTKTSSKMTIGIITQKEVIATETEAIPFETQKIETDKLNKGFERIAQQGENGEAQVTIKNTYEGTTLISSEETGRVVTKQAIDQIVEVGTKDVPSVDGYVYTEAIKVTATGYTPYDPGCNGTTSTGVAAKRGVIAVDPSVFPYGTKFYIPGYGVGVAADCGGAINGNKIDLCYSTQSEAYSWGRRTLTVYIIE